ncbi:hypothetical protein BSNK01_02680 [Bacillaceae bacterium]
MDERLRRKVKSEMSATWQSLAQEYGVQIEEVTYQDEATAYPSVLCRPQEKGPFPAVITLHGIFGLQEMDVRFAARLAAEGYIVLAHDWQAKENDPPDREIVRGIAAALRFLKQTDAVDRERIALIGVCRGGSIAMVSGAYLPEFKALVSFYGQAHYPSLDEKKPVSPIDLVERIQAPVLLIHGEADTIFSFEESLAYCRALKERGKPCECHVYPGAEHGFFLEGHRNYHREASAEAWNVLKRFLRQHAGKTEAV